MMDYNIVWFEDSKEYVESQRARLKEYLDSLGFVLNLTVREDGSDFLKILEEKDVDLLIIDQNLPGSKGDAIIEAARNNELYTEAIFYSGVEDTKKIELKLEGIFYANREDLLEKTKKIIELTIKKNLDISNIRGLFIAEAIYVTAQMEDIITEILGLSGDAQEFFKDQIVQEEFFTDFAKFQIIHRYLEAKIKSLESRIPSTIGEKNEKLTKLREKLKTTDNTLKKFQKEIIEFRNDLAHAKKCTDVKNALMIKNKNTRQYEKKSFDEMECKSIRALFIKHSRNLEEILVAMKQIDSNPK